MDAMHEGDLALQHLPKTFPNWALKGHLVPELQSHSLLSIGKFCDAGCTVELDKFELRIIYDDEIILTGHRDDSSKLWLINNPPPSQRIKAPTIASANAALGSATPEDLVAFGHASLFLPALSTLEQALNQDFIDGFPGLTATSLRKHPPRSIPMAMGHLDQSRKNQRSTKPKPVLLAEPTADAFPHSEPGNLKTHFCYAAFYEPTGQIYTDQTGKFIAPSSNGNNYLMILYNYNSNSILSEPMKSRTKHSILAAYQTLHGRLVVKAGLKPKLQRLDNECSQLLKDYMESEAVEFQLVPPDVHRRNAAERAIRTFKKHFVAGLCSTDPNFPIHLWDRLIPQAELTLNLLRGSRINPKLSAWAQLHGRYDFNKTPIAPPGTKVVVHEKPAQRGSWASHGSDGWYIGPALQSYRCWKCWMTVTRATRISDTVMFYPTKVALPVATTNDLILASLRDIRRALDKRHPLDTLAPINNKNRKALTLLDELLNPEPRETHSPLRVVQPTAPAQLPEPDTPLRVAESEIQGRRTSEGGEPRMSKHSHPIQPKQKRDNP